MSRGTSQEGFNPMYQQSEIEQHYTEVTGNTPRAHLINSNAVKQESFIRYWQESFKTIDEMFPVEEF